MRHLYRLDSTDRQRMTIEQANQQLDDQTDEMQRLEAERQTTSSQIEETRIRMAKTAKEVGQSP